MAKVFVIYYHHILKNWGFDVYYKTFEREIKILKNNYKIITLDDICEYILTGKKPEKNSVAITFDDGYLSNYVYAYPILKKHKVKATIFPVSSRILNQEIERPTLEDYWNGKVSFDELHKPPTMAEANLKYLKFGKSEDFVSYPELKKMSDIFDIGGHGSVHAKVFYEDKIEDFYDNKNGHWSFVYAYEEEPVVGFPIFPSKNNLAVRRGYLKPTVKDFIKSLDKTFFKDKNWKKNLKKLLEENFDTLVDFESEKEREERVYKELIESKNRLEDILGRKIYHFAYPFGHYDDKLVEIVSEVFKSGFTTDKGVVEHQQNIHTIPRIAVAKDISSFFGILFKVRFVY